MTSPLQGVPFMEQDEIGSRRRRGGGGEEEEDEKSLIMHALLAVIGREPCDERRKVRRRGIGKGTCANAAGREGEHDGTGVWALTARVLWIC